MIVRPYSAINPKTSFSSAFASIDFEKDPDQHLDHTPRILREAGVGENVIRSIVSHGYGICSDVQPEHEMEKVLSPLMN